MSFSFIVIKNYPSRQCNNLRRNSSVQFMYNCNYIFDNVCVVVERRMCNSALDLHQKERLMHNQITANKKQQFKSEKGRLQDWFRNWVMLIFSEACIVPGLSTVVVDR